VKGNRDFEQYEIKKIEHQKKKINKISRNSPMEAIKERTENGNDEKESVQWVKKMDK